MKKVVILFLLGVCLFFVNRSDVEAKCIDESVIPMVLYDPTLDYSILENIKPIGMISNYKDTPYIGENTVLIVYELYDYSYETMKLLVDYYASMVNKSGDICLEFQIREMTDEELNNLSSQWGDEQMQSILIQHKLSQAYSLWEYNLETGRLFEGSRCYMSISLIKY